jgi:hypothetical protein
MIHKNQITLFILITFSINSFAQNASDIFAEGKEYIYQVVFIKADGDTLTNEKLVMLGKDEEWKYQKTQTLIEYKYFPDSLALKEYIDPRAAYQKRRIKNLKKKAKGKRGWDNYTWIETEETTGKGTKNNVLFIHPPRDNQYAYHYMSAYPEIDYNKLKVGGKWIVKVPVLRGIPSNEEFVGTRIDTFQVTEKLSMDFKGKTLDDCWRIEITSTHSKKGETSAEYIFSETYGFLKLDFLFYDGVRINYVLKDLIINENSDE